MMFLTLLLCVSCATSQPKKWTDYNKTPSETYHEALGSSRVPEGLGVPAMKYDFKAPVKPVMTPPEVVPIWIYDHVTPDGTMVVGHWIFVVLREPKWYIHDRTVPDTAGSTASVNGVVLPERYEGGER